MVCSNFEVAVSFTFYIKHGGKKPNTIETLVGILKHIFCIKWLKKLLLKCGHSSEREIPGQYKPLNSDNSCQNL